MQMINLIAKIEFNANGNEIGRIGGNIPQFFLDNLESINGYNFYTTFQNPINEREYITILVPVDYSVMIEHNRYPDCSVKIVSHEYSSESSNEDHTIKSLNKAYLVGYDNVKAGEFDFITISESPMLIQSEDYFHKPLEKDNYSFFLQIDEDYYPEGLVKGNYIFGYGALYLYRNIITENIVAGFWQFS